MRTLTNIWYIARTTCLETIRHKALRAMVVLAAMLTLGNFIVTTLFEWDLGKVSIEFGLSSVAFAGLLLIFFFAMKILTDDLERHRIFMLLCRPITIGEYLCGKYLGLCYVLAISTVLLGLSSALSMYFVLAQYAAFVSPHFSWLTYCYALVCQFLSLMIILALSVFFFSFASQPFIALILSVMSYFAGQNMELLRKIVLENPKAGVLAGQEKLVIAISWIFPNLSLFDKKSVAAYGLPFHFSELLLLTVYAFSYSTLLLYGATLLFKRKELT